MNNQYCKIRLYNFKLLCLCLLLVFTTIKLFSQNPTNQIVPIKGKVTFKNGIGSKNTEIGYTFKTFSNINDLKSFSPPVFTDANGQFSTSLNVPDSLLNSLSVGMKSLQLDSLEPLNGINTYDYYLGVCHILGQKPLSNITSKYAADLNNDKKITTGNLVLFHQLISLIRSPFDYPYSFIRYLSPNANVDIIKPDSIYLFQYYKAGDVNFSSTSFQFQGNETRHTRNIPKPMAINIVNQNLIVGKTTKVKLKFTRADEFVSLQFYLKAGANLTFKNVKSNNNGSLPLFDAAIKEDKTLAVAVVANHYQTIEPSERNFEITLEVTSKVNTKLSDVLNLSYKNFGITNNTYNDNGDEGIIYLNFIDDKVSIPTKSDTLALSDSVHVIGHPVYNRNKNLSDLNYDGNQTNLSINPNPAKEEINLSFVAKSNEDMNLEIYNYNGILTYQQQIDHVILGVNNIRINTDFLTNGLYLARLKSKSTLLVTKKFIIQK